MNHPTGSQTPAQAAGITVMLLALLLVLWLGAHGRQPTTGTTTAAPAWLTAIESGADHIDAETLAAELLAAAGDLLLIDVRPAAEFAAFHLPGAVNLSVPELCGAAGAARLAARPRLVVLYSNGPAHPAQAWVELRRQGHTNVRVLDGGLDTFKARILTPPSLRDGATEATAKAAAPVWALQTAFLLGAPGRSQASGLATDPAELTSPTLVTPQWLAARLGKVAVLDVRKAPEFAALHLPGAQRLDLARLRVKSGDRDLFLQPPAALAAVFGSLGVTNSTPVVLVADEALHDATLAAVALLQAGHQALAILDGGVLRWATERRPLTSAITAPTAATYVPQPPAEAFAIGIDELATQVAAGSARVLDVRPPEFFRGEKSTEARPGHMPGAKNRPFAKDLQRTADGQWFRPAADLQREYAALGFDPAQPVVVSCRTGHQATSAWFVLRYLLGYRQARWYNGSWTEWAARAELPAVTGHK